MKEQTMNKTIWVEMFRKAGMSDDSMKAWHKEFEQRLPQEHHRFLLSLGISEEEAHQIRTSL